MSNITELILVWILVLTFSYFRPKFFSFLLLFFFFFRVFEVKFKGGEEKAYIYILKEICNGSIRLSRYFQRNLHLLIYDELWWYRGKKRTHRRKFHLNSTIEKRKKSDELNFFRVKRVSLYSPRCMEIVSSAFDNRRKNSF